MASKGGLIPGFPIEGSPFDDPWVLIINGERRALGDAGTDVWSRKASVKAALTQALSRDRRCLPKEEFFEVHKVEFVRLSTWKGRNANTKRSV